MEKSRKMTNAQNKTKTVERMLRINQSKSSSSPDIELIRKLQQRTLATNHPMFRLSIEDYENMCKDEKTLRIMAMVFNTTIEKLKKICKKIHILKENINSSPESIKNKMKAYKMSILDLPKDSRSQILMVFSSLFPKIRDWVLTNKRFHINALSESNNQIAIDYLTDNPDQIHWTFLSKNPKAIKLLEKKIKDENKLTERELIDLPAKNKISWQNLSENPKAKKLLEAKFEKEKLLDNNDLAQGIRTNRFLYLNWGGLSANPCAFDLLKRNIGKIDWRQLSINPNPEAVELLSLPENRNGVAWRAPRAESVNNSPVNLLDLPEDQNDIEWRKLSRFANNEQHMELLRKRAEYEDTLTDAEYMSLGYTQKISWDYLTVNPSIFV